MRSLALALLAALSVALNSAVASERESETCNALQTGTIAFTDSGAEDDLLLTLSGETCASATIQLSIFADESKQELGRKKVISHVVALAALTVVPDSELTKKDAQDILDQFWMMLGPHSTHDLEPWKPARQIYDLFDEIPQLDQEEYEQARKAAKPYVCIQSYYEGADCFWFTPENVTQLLLKLSD